MRILHIMGGADAGGMAAVVYNYMQHIDQIQYHFDLALTGYKPGMLGNKMIEAGAKCFYLPKMHDGIIEFQNELRRLLKREHYDVIHVHGSSNSWVALKVAKEQGIPVRIGHAHTAFWPNTLKYWGVLLLGRILNPLYATKLIGCGQLAGDVIFGRYIMRGSKGCVLPNAVDVNKFKFEPTVRDEIRQELNINGKYAIGLIGRLSHPKNQKFILPVISKLHQIMPEMVFLLVGRGEDEKELKEYCTTHSMNDYVLFTGVRHDVDRIYQGLDLFILPSLYEGFPVAAVEALASGCMTLLSDRITRELSFSHRVSYLPLDGSLWLEAMKGKINAEHREDGAREIKEHGFDIWDTAQKLEYIYNGK